MNSYELSRAWIDWAFENPQKVKPIHYAIFFFAIEHCNRLGWKKNFGLPSQMVMEAIGVKNWRTYSNGLNDLVEFGFIQMIEVSKNQYSSNIIAIVKNTKASTKALDKALSKHSAKQSQSTVSIDKQLNNITTKQLNDSKESLFDIFWTKYPKKVAKEKCRLKFNKLSTSDKDKILSTLDAYILYKPFKDYTHPNPETYLNQERWKDEIQTTSNKQQPASEDRFMQYVKMQQELYTPKN
jgi:hypothetical protein